MKSEFKKAGTLQLIVSTENFSVWETWELMQRTLDIVDNFSLITFY